MKTAVIYARYSSSSQTEQSIEGQLRVCKEYAEKNNISIINEYIDRAMTGTNDNRPSFQQMIIDSEKKNFDYVLVYKLDRFSRNKYDNAIYKHKLQQNNVRVISATETISNSPEGIIMEGLLEMFAELYSKDLSQKVRRGQRENILKGLTIGGRDLYGYKVVNKKVVIDEEQAKAVKLIFEEYAKGTRKKEIIKILNEQGYRTNKGQKFTPNGIQDKLKNRKYTGYFKNEYIEDENYYPKIIDKELFNKVQERLQHNKRFATKSKVKFLLTGKVYCGHCGANMIGTSGTSHTGKKHSYYTCIERSKRKNCNKNNEVKEELEDEVFSKIYNKILQKEELEKIADGLLNSYKQDINYNKIKEYEIKIKDIETQIEKISFQVMESTNKEIIKALNKKADDLTEQKETYQQQEKKLELALNIKHDKQDIINYLSLFLNGNPQEESFKEKIFDNFINAVYVFDNYITIYVNMFDKAEKINFEEAKEHRKQAEEQEFAHLTETSTKAKTIRTFENMFVFTKGTFGIIIKKVVR